MFVLFCENAQFKQMEYFKTCFCDEINFALLKRKQMKESKTCNPQQFLLRLHINSSTAKTIIYAFFEKSLILINLCFQDCFQKNQECKNGAKMIINEVCRNKTVKSLLNIRKYAVFFVCLFVCLFCFVLFCFCFGFFFCFFFTFKSVFGCNYSKLALIHHHHSYFIKVACSLL